MNHSLVILAYHRVLAEPDPLRPDDVTHDVFARQMKVLARLFRVLPLVEAVHRLSEGKLPARAVALTFDDGYADNYSVAWPILRHFRLPATIFVAAGYLDGGRMWNDTVIEAVRRTTAGNLDARPLGLGRYRLRSDRDRLDAIARMIEALKYMGREEREQLAREVAGFAAKPLPQDMMLRSEQVRELARSGIDIGGHTVNHPILASTDRETANLEIARGKRCLESIIDGNVRSFAYPNGKPGTDYGPEHVRMASSAGFDCAVSMRCAAARREDSVFELPRFGPWGESPARFGARMLRLSYLG